MKANLKNQTTGEVKQVKVGFSWTVFFFSFFPPFFRGDFKWGLIILAISVAATIVFPGSSFIASVVFGFMYNSIYVKGLLAKGFEPASDPDRDILSSKGYLN